jgi:hypothetical protein
MWNLFKKKPKRKPTAKRVAIPKPEGDGMVSITMGYGSYVLPASKAMQLISLVSKAELYEEVYHPELKGDHADKYTHHVYANEKTAAMKVLPDAFYKMAKLAGKPEKK